MKFGAFGVWCQNIVPREIIRIYGDDPKEIIRIYEDDPKEYL